MAGYQKLEILLREELDQLWEEGYAFDKNAWLKKIDACGDNQSALHSLYEEMEHFPRRADFPYDEPDAYEEIYSRARKAPQLPPVPEDGLNYFHGAWLGRCIGCALGQPVELWKREDILNWYRGAGHSGVDSYVPTRSGEKRNEGNATDEKIHGMPVDDDTRFTALSLMLLQEHGLDFDTYDVGALWMHRLPYRAICTAENQAYLNFASVDAFGPWGRPENAADILEKAGVNTYLNPYREWIGAQIRIDGFGYIAAGDPVLAAKLAYRDAHLSHTKNGVYGAMFFAAFIASAFAEKDAQVCFEAALAQIPERTRFYEAARFAEKLASSVTTQAQLAEKLEAEGPKYSFVHTLNNAAICIASALFADGDFTRGLTASVACGMDTDCNGATTGSFLGALLGERAIPAQWKDPLENRFSVGISPYDPGKIDDFAHEYYALYRKLRCAGN